jgi:nitroreductase
MDFNLPISQLIRKRFSCRTYRAEPVKENHLADLEAFILNNHISPFGSKIRFRLIAAKESDSQVLRGLGTYGFIKDPAGFILGACPDLPDSLLDFGYLLESIILKATDLGIGTCWLGGTFRKSRFEKIMVLEEGEIIPSVASIGYPANGQAWIDRASRLYAGADHRLTWEELFFTDNFGDPLSKELSEDYAEPLEAVRLAPSASNRQPWRILRSGKNWHFYLKRTPNYPSPLFDFLIGLADLQRIDLGIAMSHFELSALELGLQGHWIFTDPGFYLPDEYLEYTATWRVE